MALDNAWCVTVKCGPKWSLLTKGGVMALDNAWPVCYSEMWTKVVSTDQGWCYGTR